MYIFTVKHNVVMGYRVAGYHVVVTQFGPVEDDIENSSHRFIDTIKHNFINISFMFNRILYWSTKQTISWLHWVCISKAKAVFLWTWGKLDHVCPKIQRNVFINLYAHSYPVTFLAHVYGIVGVVAGVSSSSYLDAPLEHARACNLKK